MACCALPRGNLRALCNHLMAAHDDDTKSINPHMLPHRCIRQTCRRGRMLTCLDACGAFGRGCANGQLWNSKAIRSLSKDGTCVADIEPVVTYRGHVGSVLACCLGHEVSICCACLCSLVLPPSAPCRVHWHISHPRRQVHVQCTPHSHVDIHANTRNARQRVQPHAHSGHVARRMSVCVLHVLVHTHVASSK